MFDVFFISFDETNKEENWKRLLEFHPNAKRVDGVNGISTAHLICNQESTTSNFWTVDGDNWLLRSLSIPYDTDADLLMFKSIDCIDATISTIGAVKLWKKDSIVNKTMSKGDFCLNATRKAEEKHKVFSIHKYDNTPYEAWRHTFRQMVKCYSGILPPSALAINECNVQKHKDLNVYSYQGFLDAKEYVKECKGFFPKINLINDFEWLRSKCPKEMQPPL
jgi:hypothetical protein